MSAINNSGCTIALLITISDYCLFCMTVCQLNVDADFIKRVSCNVKTQVWWTEACRCIVIKNGICHVCTIVSVEPVNVITVCVRSYHSDIKLCSQ